MIFTYDTYISLSYVYTLRKEEYIIHAKRTMYIRIQLLHNHLVPGFVVRGLLFQQPIIMSMQLYLS